MTDGPDSAARDAARLRALTDFAKVVSAARSYDDVLRLVAIECRRALDAASASISVFERGTGTLRTIVSDGDVGPGFEPIPVEEVYALTDFPLTARMLADGSGFVVDTASAVDLDDAITRLLKEMGKASAIAVPLLLEGRLWGELFATRYDMEPPFTRADLDFALAVASQASAGIAQAEHVARVERLAYTDPLTGLGNRRTFDDRLDAAIARHVADGTEVAVVLVDVNGLKAVNDEYGHARGDTALISLAAVLSRVAAAVDGATVTRLGGDEFCLVLQGIPREEVVEIAERLCRDALAVLPDGVACGVASTRDAPPPITAGSQLMRLADAAQYRGKRSGARLPVIAGQHQTPTLVAAAKQRADRRSFRSSRIDTARLLEMGTAALDARGHAPVRERLTAVAESLGLAVDAASWWVSEIPPGSDRFLTRDAAMYRLPDGYDRSFRRYYDDENGYPVADYPATELASRGGPAVTVDVQTGEGDPTEMSILALEGCVGMVIVGGADATGSRWVLELHVDDLGVPVSSFAAVARWLVAVALVGARPA